MMAVGNEVKSPAIDTARNSPKEISIIPSRICSPGAAQIILPGKSAGPGAQGHAAKERNYQIHDAHVKGQLPLAYAPLGPVGFNKGSSGNHRISSSQRNLREACCQHRLPHLPGSETSERREAEARRRIAAAVL